MKDHAGHLAKAALIALVEAALIALAICFANVLLAKYKPFAPKVERSDITLETVVKECSNLVPYEERIEKLIDMKKTNGILTFLPSSRLDVKFAFIIHMNNDLSVVKYDDDTITLYHSFPARAMLDINNCVVVDEERHDFVSGQITLKELFDGLNEQATIATCDARQQLVEKSDARVAKIIKDMVKGYTGKDVTVRFIDMPASEVK